jgi:hypothetical protein
VSWRSIGAFLLVSPFLACNKPGVLLIDAGADTDGGVMDGGPDAGVDSGSEDRIDSGVDAGLDSGIDSGVDAGMDAGSEDAGVDGGPDAGPDAGIDAGADAGIDAGPDAGPASCLIGGSVYPARAANPDNLGECCNGIANPTGWTQRFAQGGSWALGPSASDAVARDLNGDGIVDLAVCNNDYNGATPGVRVYLGLPDGNFADPVISDSSHRCSQMTSGALRGDAGIDIVLAYNDVSEVGVLLNQGDGEFGGELDFDTNGTVGSVAVGDLNGDGWPDVAFGQFNGGVGVLLNQAAGDGELGAALMLSASFTSGNLVCVGDFNGDGLVDVAATGAPSSSSTTGLAMFFNDGGGTFDDAVFGLSGVASFQISAVPLAGGVGDDLAVSAGTSDL